MNSISLPGNRFSFATLLALAVVTLSLTGCATLSSFGNKSVPIGEEKAAETDLYRVEMQVPYKKPEHYVGKIDGPITVQTTLERSGAIDRFRNMDITILRVVKDSGRGLKMPVEYVPRKKSVSPEQDYAIHAGDRIMVKPVSNSMLDKLLDTVANQH